MKGPPPTAFEIENRAEALIVQESVDPNKNDAVTYTWSWTRDGAAVAEVTGPDVPAELTKRGETWTVTVIPADDKEQGASAQASITIGNAVPSAEVEITPDAPLSTDDLIAEKATAHCQRGADTLTHGVIDLERQPHAPFA